MSARKLYLGIDAAEIFTARDLAQLWQRSGLDEEHRTDKPLHVTLQYCGKEITDEAAEQIALIWAEQFAEAKLNSMEDGVVTIAGPKFELFGKENDQLVVACDVSQQFTEVVEAARAKVMSEVPEVPKSDFDFSAHLTLGEATELPKPSDHLPMVSSAKFNQVTLWGDGDVRGRINVPFHQ